MYELNIWGLIMRSKIINLQLSILMTSVLHCNYRDTVEARFTDTTDTCIIITLKVSFYPETEKTDIWYTQVIFRENMIFSKITCLVQTPG